MTTTTARSRALLANITPGDWAYQCIGDKNAVFSIHKTATDTASLIGIGRFFEPNAEDNAAFIAAAPDMVRDLCDEVERLEAELSRINSPEQRKDDPDVPNTWLTVKGQIFACKCSCQLFNQPNRNMPTYFCNSCGAEYEGMR